MEAVIRQRFDVSGEQWAGAFGISAVTAATHRQRASESVRIPLP
jgi:hypothetical protein